MSMESQECDGRMITEKSAGAVVYRNVGDGARLYLLLQPAPGKPWGFPKGKLDPGETDAEAARREIAEEAGLTELTVDPDFRHVVHYFYHRGRVTVKKDVVYFLARVDTDEIHISWEHVAYRWVALEDAWDLVSFENTRDTLRKADDHLSGDGCHATRA